MLCIASVWVVYTAHSLDAFVYPPYILCGEFGSIMNIRKSIAHKICIRTTEYNNVTHSHSHSHLNCFGSCSRNTYVHVHVVFSFHIESAKLSFSTIHTSHTRFWVHEYIHATVIKYALWLYVCRCTYYNRHIVQHLLAFLHVERLSLSNNCTTSRSHKIYSYMNRGMVCCSHSQSDDAVGYDYRIVRLNKIYVCSLLKSPIRFCASAPWYALSIAIVESIKKNLIESFCCIGEE